MQLAADAALRARFARDPERALAPFELTARERAALCSIELADLERYAQSLIAKRWDEVARIVPLAIRVVPSLGALYRTWAASHPARGEPASPSPGIAEALRAERALAAMLADEAHAPYAADLWRFEVARAAARRDGVVRMLSTRFAVHALGDDIARGLLPFDPPVRATEYRCERERVLSRDL